MRCVAAGVIKTVPKTSMMLHWVKDKVLGRGKKKKGANAGALADELRASTETVGKKRVGCKTGLKVNHLKAAADPEGSSAAKEVAGTGGDPETDARKQPEKAGSAVVVVTVVAGGRSAGARD